jgi:hypothetical protein
METKDWIATVGVLGTWVIAIAAIWGEKIRSWAFRPELQLRLKDSAGEFCNQNIETVFKDGLRAHESVPARYYHLRVTNSKAYPAAHEVQVLLAAVDRAGPSGEPQRIYTGALPLGWASAQLHPLARTIGSKTEADADFFFVRAAIQSGGNAEDAFMHFTPMLLPNNFQAKFSGDTHLWITAIARGLDGESRPLRFED